MPTRSQATAWTACRDYINEKIGAPEWEPTKLRAGRFTSIPARVGEKPKSSPAAYVYNKADGSPYLRVNRTAAKKFWQERRTGIEWVKGAPDGPKIPYRLPELLAAEHDDVLIVEGEKDADNLASLAFTATTNSEGAGKFDADLAGYFAGKNVYVLPDNDEPGAKHARQVAATLSGVARSICIVELPDLPEKGDVSDWLAAGGTADQLADLLRHATETEATGLPRLLKSSGEFVAGFTPPDYLIDGLIQRRFCYSLTAPTGSGKTAVLLLLCALIALGRKLGEIDLDGARVLFLAGENPDDIRMRWLAMAHAMNFDPAELDVHFLPGVFNLGEIGDRIRSEVGKIGPVALVVDFTGDNENDNVHQGHMPGKCGHW